MISPPRNMAGENVDGYLDVVMQSALHHSRREKRREMVYLLGELYDDRALDALDAIMSEDDPYLVCESVRAAGKIGGPKALKQLQAMANHPSFMVRGEVALALGAMADEDGMKLIDELQNDSSPYVAGCAGNVLDEIKYPKPKRRRYSI